MPMLLPVDMREWLDERHPARVLVVLMEQVLDTEAIVAGWARLGGRGRAAYDPVMLATLLVWALLDAGEQSCEKIAARCRRDVAYRFVCGEHVPDEETIRRFREQLFAEVDDVARQVLQLCALAGLGDFTLSAVDGTKMLAAASKKANRTEPTLAKLADELDARAAALGDAGQRVIDGVPAAPAVGKRARASAALDRTRRQRQAADEAEAARVAAYQAKKAAGGPMTGKIPRSIRLVEEQARLEELIAGQEAKLAAWTTKRAAGLPVRGHRPKVHDHYKVKRQRERVERLRAEAAAAASDDAKNTGKQQPRPVANLTDPESSLMPTANGFVQGYNCQAGATLDRLLVAGSCGQQPGDVGQAAPMLVDLTQAVELFITTRVAAGFCCSCRFDCPGSEPDRHADPRCHARWRADVDACAVHHGLYIDWVLFDAGYLSTDNLTADGPPRLIALGKTRDQLTAADRQPAAGPPDPDASPHQRNAHWLRTPEGAAAYRQRGFIAESPFGHFKHNKGVYRLHTRGLHAATAEWTFIRTCHNLAILLNTIQTDGIDLAYLATLARTVRRAAPAAAA